MYTGCLSAKWQMSIFQSGPDQTLVGLENFNWSDSGNTFCLSESEFSLGILNKGQPFSENTFGSQDNTQMIFRIAKKIAILTPVYTYEFRRSINLLVLIQYYDLKAIKSNHSGMKIDREFLFLFPPEFECKTMKNTEVIFEVGIYLLVHI